MMATIEVNVSPRSQSEPVVADGTSFSSFRATQERRTVPFAIPASQRYFWSEAWQEGERDTDAALAAGETLRFTNVRDAIRYLLSTDD